MDSKHTNPTISDSSNEVGQLCGDEAMHEEIAEDKTPTINSQASGVMSTNDPNKNNYLFHTFDVYNSSLSPNTIKALDFTNYNQQKTYKITLV